MTTTISIYLSILAVYSMELQKEGLNRERVATGLCGKKKIVFLLYFISDRWMDGWIERQIEMDGSAFFRCQMFSLLLSLLSRPTPSRDLSRARCSPPPLLLPPTTTTASLLLLFLLLLFTGKSYVAVTWGEEENRYHAYSY